MSIRPIRRDDIRTARPVRDDNDRSANSGQPGRADRPHSWSVAIRVLVIAQPHYLDPRDPAAAALRRLVVGLSQAGASVEVFTGTTRLDPGPDDPIRFLATLGHHPTVAALNPPPDVPRPDWPHPPAHLRIEADGVPVHLFQGPTTQPHDLDPAERAALAAIIDHLLDESHPDALIVHDANPLTALALHTARHRGVSTALRLRHRGPHDPAALALADILLAPSQVLADEIHQGTGRPCAILTDFLDLATVRAETDGPPAGARVASPATSPAASSATGLDQALATDQRRIKTRLKVVLPLHSLF